MPFSTTFPFYKTIIVVETFHLVHIPTGCGKGPRNIAVGDLNGDGKPDIVVANFNSGIPVQFPFSEMPARMESFL
jgi:hypothetical protein